MKQLILIPLVVSLSGCISIAVKREFPKIPTSLETHCADLELISDDTDKLSDMLSTVTLNYSKYHECKLKVDLWIEWYDTQLRIFNEVQQ